MSTSTTAAVEAARRLPSHWVARPRLLDALDGALEVPLTYVSGPAGSGKTALVADWCRMRGSLPLVWVDVGDCAHGTPLAQRVISAASRLDPAAAARMTDWTTADGQRLTPRGVAQLAELLERAPETLIVLDGLDDEQSAHACVDLAAAVRRTSQPRLHLIVAGRVLPPAELVPLQLDEAGHHIDAWQLALRPDELGEVVGAIAGVSLSAEVAAEANRRLDGWVAAAVLVGLSARGLSRPLTADQLIDCAYDRIEAYVNTHMLDPLPAVVRQRLCRTACVDTLPSALADVLGGHRGSDRLFHTLYVSGFPVRRRALEAGVAYEHLRPVRLVLDRQQQRDDPDERRRALRAAAEWFEHHRMGIDAAECWARLGEWERVRGVVHFHLQEILRRGEIARLCELLRTAPAELLRTQSELALGGAWVLRHEGRIGSCLEMLGLYEPYMDAFQRMVADVIRSGTASWVDDVQAPLRFASAAIAASAELGEQVRAPGDVPLARTEPTARTYRLIAESNALVAAAYGGEWTHPAARLAKIDPESQTSLTQLQLVQLHGYRAAHLALAGQPNAALREARAGLTVAGESDVLDHPMAADLHFSFGEASRKALRYDDAASALDRALLLARVNARRNLEAAIIGSHAHLAVDTDGPDAALRVLERHRGGEQLAFPTTLAALLATAEARALAASGAHGDALVVLDSVPPTSAVTAVRVAILLAAGDVDAARAAANAWPDRATDEAQVRRALALAAVADAERRPDRAMEALRRAVRRAAPHDLMQPVVEYHPRLNRLLVRLDDHGLTSAEQAYVRALRARSRGGPASGVAPRFTEREVVVLAHLAEDLPLKQIAAELHVSLNTVKTHVKALYRKLGVNSRGDAVREWRRSISASN